MSDLVFPEWVTLEVSPTFPKWKLVRFEYVAPEDVCNNGSTNVYVATQTSAGLYQPGIQVWQDWQDDKASETMKPLADAVDYCGSKYGATFFQSGDSSFDPNKGQAGPYTFYVDGNSDKVHGLGLPLKRHVQDVCVWQWTTAPTPPPVKGGHWELVDATNRNNPQLKWVRTVP